MHLTVLSPQILKARFFQRMFHKQTYTRQTAVGPFSTFNCIELIIFSVIFSLDLQIIFFITFILIYLLNLNAKWAVILIGNSAKVMNNWHGWAHCGVTFFIQTPLCSEYLPCVLKQKSLSKGFFKILEAFIAYQNWYIDILLLTGGGMQVSLGKE